MTEISSNKIYSRSSNKLDEITSKESSKSIFISQEKNFANNHGFHYRSSASFISL